MPAHVQRIPDWWSWYYYLNPFSWSIYGLVASQLGHDFIHTVNTYGCAQQGPACTPHTTCRNPPVADVEQPEEEGVGGCFCMPPQVQLQVSQEGTAGVVRSGKITKLLLVQVRPCGWALWAGPVHRAICLEVLRVRCGGPAVHCAHCRRLQRGVLAHSNAGAQALQLPLPVT